MMENVLKINVGITRRHTGTSQGCRVGVAQSQRFLNRVGFLRTLESELEWDFFI